MSAASDTIEHARARTLAQPPAALPRLLLGIDGATPLGLDEHLDVHGSLPRIRGGGRRRGRERAAALIAEVERSGLCGRGGAGFPTATKLRAVARQRGRAIVVVNAVEAEPASAKDATLLDLAPHVVLDGAVLAAEALGAEEIVIGLGEGSPAATSVLTAIAEYEDEGAPRAPRIELAQVPRRYVSGQESALIDYLDGGPGLPRFTPPMPFERGLRRRPTLVNNAETLAHVALIARHGAAWFRELGTPTQPGSALVTLSGAVAFPGVYEIEHGATLASLIDAGGGLTGAVHGVLTGGYGGSWIGVGAMDSLELEREQLAHHGATFGAGIVLLLSAHACPVAETERMARWLAAQSARQCGPCLHGLDAIAETFAQIRAGGAPRALERLERLASLTAGRGACGHPDGAVTALLSAVAAFPSQFDDHAAHGPCESCSRRSELALPGAVEPARGRPSGAVRR